MTLATAAAFTAAAISLLNIIVTARLGKLGTLHQWHRDEMRPIVAKILALSRETLATWDSLTLTRILWLRMRGDPAKHDEMEKYQLKDLEEWETGHDQVAALRVEVASLDLIAHIPAREAARALLQAHEDTSRLLLREHREDAPLKGAGDTIRAFREDRKRLEDDLIEKARADLGLPGTGWRALLRISPARSRDLPPVPAEQGPRPRS
ncbi:MAG: hypothetical protein ACM32E_28190 [Gemmatimonadota bacterium]